MITIEELERFVLSRSWYQSINFSDKITSRGCQWCGDPAWINIVKLLPENLNGMSVLDLGCNAGIFCVRSALMGADYVVGIDYPGWRPHWDFEEQRVFVKSYFEQLYNIILPIHYISGRMEEVLKRLKRKFNYIFGIASLYYTSDPDSVVMDISRLADKVIIRVRDNNRVELFTSLFKKYGYIEKQMIREKWWEKLNRNTDDFYLFLFEKY